MYSDNHRTKMGPRTNADRTTAGPLLHYYSVGAGFMTKYPKKVSGLLEKLFEKNGKKTFQKYLPPPYLTWF